MFIFNQAIFFILIGLFYLAGIKLANKKIKNKEKNKKMYDAVKLSFPIGFLLAFFILDSLLFEINIFRGYNTIYTIFVYWLTMTFAGLIIGFIILLIFIHFNKVDLVK